MAPTATSHWSSPSPVSPTQTQTSSSKQPRRLLQARLHILALTVTLLSFLPVPSWGKLPDFAHDDVVDENNLTEGDPQLLDLQELAGLLRRLQQEEDDLKNATSQGLPEARSDMQEDPRFIGITDGGLYRGDLVVYLPVTILLPTFAFRSRYSLAGRENAFDWSSFLFGESQGRSRDTDAEEENSNMDVRGPVDQVLTNQVRYDPDLFEYKTDPNYGPLLSRIDAYFHYLKVHDDECRARAICHLAQEHEKYSPISYLILSALKKSEHFKRPMVYNPHVFRFLRYYWAAERGAANNSCIDAYLGCPAGLEDIVNMRILTFWQYLSSVVSINLSDE